MSMDVTLRQWVDEAEHVVVFTGAGMSTESGIPDSSANVLSAMIPDPEPETSTALQPELVFCNTVDRPL